jgi:Arc/MetJ-type ribon-helix-helix transcriptional regulator
MLTAAELYHPYPMPMPRITRMLVITAMFIPRGSEERMRTVHVTLDEELIAAVDKLAKRLGMSRSALTREALRATLARIRIQEPERKHRAGYVRRPVKKGEFSIWEGEQIWGDG